MIPDGSHLLTDTYTWEETAFGDGTIPLRWVDLATGDEQVIVRINTQQPVKTGAACRSASRLGPYVALRTFNGFVGGTRRVFIADMQELVAK